MIVVQLPLQGFIALFNKQAPQEWGLRGFLFFEAVDRALVFGDTERPWTLDPGPLGLHKYKRHGAPDVTSGSLGLEHHFGPFGTLYRLQTD